MIPQLPQNLKLIHKFSSITHLTIFSCGFHEFYRILNNAFVLKYLKLEYLHQTNNYAFYLNKLIIMHFDGKHNELFMILKHTSNLKSLTINAFSYENTIELVNEKI
jgi:UDP-2,3-diacylglucosamine pyrophosphatase LpxH